MLGRERVGPRRASAVWGACAVPCGAQVRRVARGAHGVAVVGVVFQWSRVGASTQNSQIYMFHYDFECLVEPLSLPALVSRLSHSQVSRLSGQRSRRFYGKAGFASLDLKKYAVASAIRWNQCLISGGTHR